MQNNRVAEAVYNVPWYEAGTRFRKTLLIFLMQTQHPMEVGGHLGAFHLRVIARTVIHFHSGCCALHFILQIRVGNVYPMTLAMFQSLLNASYSYFTMLRGVTGK